MTGSLCAFIRSMRGYPASAEEAAKPLAGRGDNRGAGRLRLNMKEEACKIRGEACKIRHTNSKKKGAPCGPIPYN